MLIKFGHGVFLAAFLLMAGCGSAPKTPMVHPASQAHAQGDTVWDDMSGFSEHMRFKTITPLMVAQIEDLMAKGCILDYEVLDNDTAYLYSLIPGGGQFYTGEPKKAFMYLLGSVLIIPYFVAIEDAQRTVNYVNTKYAIEFCKQRLRLSKKYEESRKKLDIINEK